MAGVCPQCILMLFVLLACCLGQAQSPPALRTTTTTYNNAVVFTGVRKIVGAPPPLSSAQPPNSGSCNQICGVGGSDTVPSMTECGCVLPIKVGLQLQVTLDALFPLMIELAVELADGSFLQQSQVRIVGANPVTDNPDNTIVAADLVPLGNAFDMTYIDLITERFEMRQVFINESLFGVYTVQYLTYPGGPSYPPQSSNGGGVGSPSASTGPNNGSGAVAGGKGQEISKGLVALVALSSGFGLVVVFGAISVVCIGLNSRDHHDERMAYDQPPISGSFRGSVDGSRISSLMANSPSMSFISSIAACAGFVRTFTLYELEIATERFHPDNVVGEGGFGRVYRGRLEDGCDVAVKVLTGAGREFVAEVEVLSRLHHRNLVKLVGICTEDYTRCLVYELVSNGSLESHLHGVDRDTAPLDWKTRVKIALGAARGLAYLHEDSNPRVIHRDFKASNILLEDDCTPKVSDFGLAKVATEGGNEEVSTRVMGTFGYVAPEYAMTGHLLVKSDVYSFGVVLLELLTGRQPVDMDRPSGQENLVTWARPLLTNKDAIPEFIDPALEENYPQDDLVKVAAVAYRCVHPEVSQRPFMGEVVQTLKLVDPESIAAAAAGGGASAADASGTAGSTPTPSGYQNRPELSPGALSNGKHYSTSLSDSWRRPANSRYMPDGVLLMNMDYDSGPWNSLDVESSRPLSASAALPSSARPFSSPFQFQQHSISGPLRPLRTRISSWYNSRNPRRDGISSDEHRHAARFNPRMRSRLNYQLWT